MTVRPRSGRALAGAAAIVLTSSAAVGVSTAGHAGELPGVREEIVFVGAERGAAVIDLSRFVDERDPDTVLAAVRAAWSLDRSAVMASRRGDWLSLTRAVAGGVETVEVRPQPQGVEGRVIRARASAAPRPDPDLDLAWITAALPDAEPAEPPLTHRDGGRVMTTLVTSTTASVAMAAGEVRRVLAGAGFRDLAGAHGPAVAATARGRALVMVRGAEEIAVTISDHGARRAVVVHRGRGR